MVYQHITLFDSVDKLFCCFYKLSVMSYSNNNQMNVACTPDVASVVVGGLEGERGKGGGGRGVIWKRGWGS